MGLLDLNFGPDARLGLLAAGLSMLGARKGHELQDFGSAGLLGLQTAQQAGKAREEEQMRQLQAQNMMMQLRESQQKFADADAQRQALIATAGAGAPSPMQAAMGQAPSLAPTQANVAAVTSAAAQMPAPGLFEQLTARGRALMDYGQKIGNAAVYQQGMGMLEQAQKFAPKYKGLETVMQGGKPVLLQTYDNQAPQPLQGFAPKPDFKQVDTGASIGFVDPVTSQQGPMFAKQMTPGETARLPIEQGNLAVAQGNLGVNRGKLGVEEARLALARNADARAASNEGAPSLITNPVTGDVYAVNKRTATGTQVMGPDGKPLAGPIKPLTESQANAVMFGIRAKDADTTMRAMQASGFNPTGPGMAKDMATNGRLSTNWLASDAGGKYLLAAKNFVAAALRKESGAQINESEWQMGQQLYVPMPGDGPERLAQKARNRELVMSGMGAAAGQGERQIEQRIPPMNDAASVRARADAIINGGK